MEEKRTYTIVARCQICGKHIAIELSVSFVDKSEFGEKLEYSYSSDLPAYLKMGLRKVQDYFQSNASAYKNTTPSAYNKDLPICKNCLMVEKMKET